MHCCGPAFLQLSSVPWKYVNLQLAKNEIELDSAKNGSTLSIFGLIVALNCLGWLIKNTVDYNYFAKATSKIPKKLKI